MMSPKTSCKGARNPCREMTHENSGWAGHSATAGADEESDVAGYSAAAIVDERRVASSTIGLPRCESVKSQKSAQVPFVPLFRACIVGRSREVPQPFHLGGAVLVTVTTPIESLGNLSPRLKDSISGEDNTTHTIDPSNSNTVSNLGLASILTKDVRVHGAWSEFLNKFPDRSNMTFEETDGGLDRSHESLGAAFKTRQRRETRS